ncbi:IgGFc-binding protein-like [Pecten maximus]|uniref:IgGFc-binding protein-like n=1 Tax=Pecten maximus TaxID=6579 RepID=UPI0014585ACB|nr:IgGFc-binding protein-like [Pecten maximus]
MTGTWTYLVVLLVIWTSSKYSAAIRCLSCNDVIQPRHCSVIKHCPDGDSCVTEAYRNENGEYLFNLGCMSAQRCALINTTRSAGTIGKDVQSLCTDCCHGDLCNAAGCRTEGFPSRRGPVCLDCQQSRDPSTCDVITVCLEGELCHVEETHQFGDVFYKTGCLRNFECAIPPVYNPVEVGRRAIRRRSCFFCCQDDLCNTKCTNTSSHPQTCEDKSPDCAFYSNHLHICNDVDAAKRMGCYKTCNLCGVTAITSGLSTVSSTPMHQGNVMTSTVPLTITTTIPTTIPTTVHLAPSTRVTTTQAPPSHGFTGKEYFIMFMENFSYIYSLTKLFGIMTVSSPNTEIQVITHDSSTSNIVSGPVYNINIDANMTMRRNGKTTKGIIVASNTTTSVTAFNINNLGLMEGFHVLPIEALGTSYIVGTLKPLNLTGSSFAVGAPHDNTVVNITLSTSAVSVPGQYHRDGDTITVVLDKLDTFYIEAKAGHDDLTGTRIESDKPVAVISGNLCSNGEQKCNHLVEYLPPVSKWGSKFMVPPIAGSNSGIIRIMASVNDTSVHVSATDFNKTYTVSNFIDVDMNTSLPYAISSDKPILVLLFPVAASIAMTIVPSIDQFSHESVLVAPPTGDPMPFQNYLVISIRVSDMSGLEIHSSDGGDLPLVASTNFPDIDGEMFSFMTVSCNKNQTCSVQHTNKNAVFSVIVYGRTATEMYAYPANIML